ncbi:MAG: hypothetical protein A3I04_02805 [Nitrospinae bacterium RIFCSPLOWO2_02_FULL_39_110]|nr:MAG: hypothetical protein A2W53_00320 [Nitrospinae bacterium RIFCSPHIGHO2_02_39_11]OGV97880.1 MAG: hypothetical protein A3D97_09130 [Nitrospinae bacterium RIFCSPHIGHO2_12_FULL_39_42]OGW03193.1 MAG: hypothetical protein A3D20_01495 [Nitrospinae bacterium RIFCSPHIGHO2_02_FULL_39_82]OGW03514.1 MAG: hypothetical protein A3I04_02805 [Nitrospinae bacterium RIFCSPLOWO2_02_FULL_39_110]OGW06526.1 MAG: hypothetical protein A2Z59_08210 [Nitrospinae bacterium RIFCSPLOWO2_02_39_17]OGW08446.1 MAG: hypoth
MKMSLLKRFYDIISFLFSFQFSCTIPVNYLVSENFNLMLETAWNSTESVQSDGTKTRGDTFFINPGMRGAINFESGLQIVPGIAAPIGIRPSENEYGVFLYLSFEHPLF